MFSQVFFTSCGQGILLLQCCSILGGLETMCFPMVSLYALAKPFGYRNSCASRIARNHVFSQVSRSSDPFVIALVFRCESNENHVFSYGFLQFTSRTFWLLFFLPIARHSESLCFHRLPNICLAVPSGFVSSCPWLIDRKHCVFNCFLIIQGQAFRC